MVPASRHQLGHRPETGAVALLTAIMMLVALVMAAFAIDLSTARSDTTLADAAADAGALGGAQSLPDPTRAHADATAFATTALSGGQTGTGATITVTTPYSVSGYPSSRLIRVRVCWRSKTGFAAAFGISGVDVCGSATAYKTDYTPCGLCVLGPTGQTLSVGGSGSLGVSNADIHVNSSGTPAAGVNGNNNGGVSATGQIRILGTYSAPNSSTFSPTPITGVPAIPDPLADVPVPAVAGPMHGSVSSSSAPVTLQPGIYDSITSTSTGRVTFSPGIYVIRQGMSLQKSANAPSPAVVGDGVVFYFACANYPTPCTPGQSGAGVSISGGTTFSFTGPTSGPYTNLVVFYDRNNTAQMSMSGGSFNQISGTLYAKSAEYRMTGTQGSLSLNGAVVVGRVLTQGSANYRIAFDSNYAHPDLNRAAVLVE